ncbi:MAG: CocE/NonD family hydrolase [Gemmatimonadetes bacterium]|nr:CocE/NonD family hydrolase [Gemmatimonadota bacterium]
MRNGNARRLSSFALVVASLLVASSCTRNAPNPAADEAFDVKAHYVKSEYMVPMRDGVKLFTIVYTPRDTTQATPFLLVRTPYSIPPYEPDVYKPQLGPSPEFDREGYIFVYQDVRGKYRSEGQFVLLKPYQAIKRDTSDVDESSDVYDTIDWLLGNIPHNNGRVGQWGVSYPGYQTVMGMLAPHAALKASSPQASPSDSYIGDDFLHNGAFRFMYAFSWLSGNARPRTAPTEERGKPFDYGTPDGYRFFMDVGTPARVDELYFHGAVPDWTTFMEHPNYDAYWTAQGLLKDLGAVPATLPILDVAGWFDAEDFYGPLSIFYRLEKLHPQNKTTLVVGPWRHGGWNSTSGAELGNIRFGSETSRHFQTTLQFPFFQHYLKDKGEWNNPKAVVFETGNNVWHTYPSWPPPATRERKLYFHADGALSFTPPAAPGYDEYVNDPAKPVPFSSQTRTTQGALWMIEDPRFASTRPDVLVYETEPLTEPVTIAGPIIASLRVSTSGTDADWIVKLIDVLPGDAPDNEPVPRGADPAPVRMGHFQMLLAGEVFRSKYRESYETPVAMVPSKVTQIEFDLRDRFHTFKPGHRIMVQVQSSWFPLIDRNPGQFMDIYHAKRSDYKKTTQRVYRSPQDPSHLALNVLQ